MRSFFSYDADWISDDEGDRTQTLFLASPLTGESAVKGQGLDFDFKLRYNEKQSQFLILTIIQLGRDSGRHWGR